MSRIEENLNWSVELEKFIIESFDDYDLSFRGESRDDEPINADDWSPGVRQSRNADWFCVDLYGINDNLTAQLNIEDAKVFTNFLNDIVKQFMTTNPDKDYVLKNAEASVSFDGRGPQSSNRIKTVHLGVIIEDKYRYW